MATLEQAQHDIAVKKGKAEAPAEEEAEVVTAEELVETPEDDEGEDAAE